MLRDDGRLTANRSWSENLVVPDGRCVHLERKTQTILRRAAEGESSADVRNWWLQMEQYGDFSLPRGLRPYQGRDSSPHPIYPIEGYVSQKTSYRDGDEQRGIRAAVSREKIVPIFFDLVETLGREVNVFIGTHQDVADVSPITTWVYSKQGDHELRELCREDIENSVFQSHMHNYENLISDDGCFNITVINSDKKGYEITLDSHKVFTLLGSDPDLYIEILKKYDVGRSSRLQFIDQGSHRHFSEPGAERAIIELADEISAADWQQEPDEDDYGDRDDRDAAF